MGLARSPFTRYEAILCADWSGSPGPGREVYAAFPSSRMVRRLEPPTGGWSVATVLGEAAKWSPRNGPVLVGFDAPIGMPRSLWDALAALRRPATNFAQWLDAVEGLDELLDPVAAPEDWRVDKPFFRVLEGPGGRQRFEDAAKAAGVEVLRTIDRQTRAKPLLIVSGIPGVPGASACDVWRSLRACRGSPDSPLIWPFEVSLTEPVMTSRLIVAEIYPRLACGIALGSGPPPWAIKGVGSDRRQALADLLGSTWVQQCGVRIAHLAHAEASRDAFDALISAAALLRLSLEGLPLSDPAREDALAEGGMLGSGTVRWPDDEVRPRDRSAEGPSESTSRGGETARDASEHKLLASLRSHARELQAQLTRCSDHWGYEDAVYRFYHQSFKVYRVQSQTEAIVAHLSALLPGHPLNDWFLAIVREGTGHTFETSHNERWLEVCRPILEAFLHARFFLEMAVRYSALEAPPRPLPSGYAALLYLYRLR